MTGVFGHGYRRITVLSLWALAAAGLGLAGEQSGAASAGHGSATTAAPTFTKDVRPVITRYCYSCHNAKVKTAGLDLGTHRSEQLTEEASAVWESVAAKVRSGEMPPQGAPRLKAHEVEALTSWVDGQLERLNRERKPNPGRVTARRLNRSEYNNTIRDLLGIYHRPADDFPADDSGYGFDNIGDVLSLPPMLMEKSMAAAYQISQEATGLARVQKPTMQRYMAPRAGEHARKEPGAPSTHLVRHVFPVDAEYQIRVKVLDRRKEGQPVEPVHLFLDGKRIGTFEAVPGDETPREFDVRVRVEAGEHVIKAALERDYIAPSGNKANPRPERKFMVDFLQVSGPYSPAPVEQRASYARVFVCGHKPGTHQQACARQIVKTVGRRAWRRSLSAQETERLLSLYQMVRREGDSFEQGLQVALQAMLVSPHFLFRIEREAPSNAGADSMRSVTALELASRLSYFLWSSMPDDELLDAAEKGTLLKPAVLEKQVRRMMRDIKSAALVENFAGQWLHLRNLKTAAPDPERFPEFDEELRQSMIRETQLFIEHLVREDGSLLDLLDSRYTYLNARLARHYGMEGIEGDEFRRVELNGAERGGVLSHASVLTVSSYPTRTSPVLRGVWILENLLGAPPPPPPPDVPRLEESEVALVASLRERLEKHRTDPTCAACHSRMDPLGFGLENYDAVGAWRTHDGEFAIDASGALPNGQSFDGPAALKQVLMTDREAYLRTVTTKMLTFALGRGVERYDRPSVDSMVRDLEQNEYRFSTLILGIVKSLPFQKRRNEGGKVS
jgi:mono/diheme cytochrome c family protein